MTMKKEVFVVIGLAVFLTGGQHASFAQGSAAQIVDAKKLSDLQLDLLLEQKKGLESKAQWLNAEQKAFNLEAQAWQKSKNDLQVHLNKTFDCTFDMDKRVCQPKTEGKKETKEKSATTDLSDTTSKVEKAK